MKTWAFLLLISGAVAGQKPPAGKPVVKMDTTVNNTLKLLDPASIRQSIGDQRQNLIEDEKATRVQLANRTNSEYVILYHLDGSNENSFNEFEIGTLKAKSRGFRTSTFTSFSTESGVHLGMTEDSIIALKGKMYKRTVGKGGVVLSYRVTDEHVVNNILMRYNMQIYQADYLFRDGKLIKFTFGFPNL